MSFISSLPKRDPIYDVFRAKLSLMYVLKARNYDLEDDEDLLDEHTTIKDKYQIFKDKIVKHKPTSFIELLDKVYTNLDGFMSPLIVRFIEAKRVFDEIKTTMQESKTPTGNKRSDRKKTPRQHYLYVVDTPVNETQSSSIIGINTLEILSYHNLFLNPQQHYRSPTIVEKLDVYDHEAMLSNPALSGKILPGLNPKDPMVLFLDMGPGDIYRSIGTNVYTGQNLYTVGYRIAPKSVKCNTDKCDEPASTYRTPYCTKCLKK